MTYYLAKSNKSKKCMICHYWFFHHGFEFQDSVCNDCHDLAILSVNISDIAIITVKNVDCRCMIHSINKSEAINLLKNYVLKIVGIYKKVLSQISVYSKDFFFTFFVLLYIKWLIVRRSISL